MVYLVVLATTFTRLIERVYWDSDAATAGLVGEGAGDGAVVLFRYGWFTSLWFELLTRSLPFHRQVWEVAPYVFALASVALLAWASWRLAGPWAAAMTATVAVAASPFVNYSRVTVNYHTATWVATVVLAVFALWLAQKPRIDRAITAGVLVTLLAGTTLASDLLFAFVGLTPLAVTGLLLLFMLRSRFEGALIVASAALALPVAWVTSQVMSASRIEVVPVSVKFADVDQLWPNFVRWVRMSMQLSNGDYVIDARLGARSLLAAACAALVLVALAIPFVLVGRELLAATPSPPRLVYASFWATCLALNGASFVSSSEGNTGHYLTPTLYALAATVPIAFSGKQCPPTGRCGGNCSRRYGERCQHGGQGDPAIRWPATHRGRRRPGRRYRRQGEGAHRLRRLLGLRELDLERRRARSCLSGRAVPPGLRHALPVHGQRRFDVVSAALHQLLRASR